MDFGLHVKETGSHSWVVSSRWPFLGITLTAENRLGRSLREMEAQIVIQVKEDALSGGGSAGGGEKWSEPGYFFPKENKKDSRSVVNSERKWNGSKELLLRLEGCGAEAEEGLALDLRFLFEELEDR